MANYPPEPFRIKMVEPIQRIDRQMRVEALRRAGYNLFNLSDDFYRLINDSGLVMSEAHGLRSADSVSHAGAAFVIWRKQSTTSSIPIRTHHQGRQRNISAYHGQGSQYILPICILTPRTPIFVFVGHPSICNDAAYNFPIGIHLKAHDVQNENFIAEIGG
jgi:hypothetical protein